MKKLKHVALKCSLVGLAGFGAWEGGASLIDSTSDAVTRGISSLKQRFKTVETVVQYIRPGDRPLKDVIKETSLTHDIPSLLLSALIVQESGAGLRGDRMRYEPHLQKRFKCQPWETDAECRAYATSFGYGQVVYGLHKKFCSLESYADLLDPEVNLHCSAKILRECLNRRDKVKDKAERFKLCLGEYNGDDTGRYASSVMDHLARIVLEQTL